jgi:hypothetical protein
VDAAVAEENQRWGGKPTITVVKELVGDRPADRRRRIHRSCGAAWPRLRRSGSVRRLAKESTDSNTPMSLKIPAITIGGGGRGRDAHALTESFDVTDAWMGTQHALLVRDSRSCSRDGRPRRREDTKKIDSLLFVASCLRGDPGHCDRLFPRRSTRPTSIPFRSRTFCSITIDTLRADALGCYGGPAATRRSLDRLAREGVRFDFAHAHAVVTLPSARQHLDRALPIRAWPARQQRLSAARGSRTAATVLKQGGYATAAFVAGFPLHSRFGLNQASTSTTIASATRGRRRFRHARAAGVGGCAARARVDRGKSGSRAVGRVGWVEGQSRQAPADRSPVVRVAAPLRSTHAVSAAAAVRRHVREPPVLRRGGGC